MADQDNRLCANVTSCRDFQRSYHEGLDACSGCDGDLREYRLVTDTIDTVLKPVIDKVRHATPEENLAAFIASCGDVRVRLEGKGHKVSPAEVGILISTRLMQRVASLEAIVRMQQRKMN